MKLKQITEKVFYYPHQPQTDRPLLAYIKGKKMALAIDAGNSSNHVDEFYGALHERGLETPDMTAITHWHWDHTFGMHHIQGFSLAHYKTNEFLNKEKSKLLDCGYVNFLKDDDVCFAKEYAQSEVSVVPSDIQFDKRLDIDLGSVTAKLFHTVAPHSEDTVIVYVPEEKILFLGDATSEDFFNKGFMDRNKLRELIKRIESIDCEYCILSHAEPLRKEELLSYLKSL